MKKYIAALCGIVIALAGTIPASAYEQQELYAAADKALDWIVAAASPMMQPESAAADNAVTALARMGKDFDYNKYLSYTQSRNPSTDKDGQRLIMTETACGSKASDSFVRMYTYDHMREDAADLSGAMITLDSGGYAIHSDDISMEHMVLDLMTMQQPDGSFGGDIYTTARSMIALSFHRGSRYDISGDEDSESYSYSTETAIANATNYLASRIESNGGYGTFTNTAYVIMALDSVGINAEKDSRFTPGGSSPVSWIMTQQVEDGSFNYSPDDTALAACALVSHLRSVQGKSSFFHLRSSDSVTAPEVGSTGASTSSGSSKSSPAAREAAPVKTDPPVVRLTPLPSRSPQHSALDEEEYGPIPPMGPIAPDKTEKPVRDKYTYDSEKHTDPVAVILIVSAALFALAGGALVYIYYKHPEKLQSILEIIKKKASGDTGYNSSRDQRSEPVVEKDILNDMAKTEPAVSTEELYDPDFVKNLIPVDELDDSINPIVDEQSTENEK